MKTNDLKKGMRVRLMNGWDATIQDNKRGNIRMATVDGHFTETGSIYAWDIAYLYSDQGMIKIVLTEAQKKARKLATSF